MSVAKPVPSIFTLKTKNNLYGKIRLLVFCALLAADVTSLAKALGLPYGYDGKSIDDPLWYEFFSSAWMTNNLTSPDLLRQRMAFNLSQIMMINDISIQMNTSRN